jgi:hypothetical protein
MRTAVSCLAALVVVLAVSGAAQAQQPGYPGYANRPLAPDACGPGFACYNFNGAPYGPNYWLQPGGLPFNGMLPPPPWANGGAGGNNVVGFPTHPYARSPRDYFMLDLR